jgi:RND superfamily putative drug exporter
LLRHPIGVLASSLVIIVLFAILGRGVEDKLSPTTLDIPGTEAFRANQMLRDHFGPTAPFAILLQGPPAAIDRQGPKLIRALREDPKVTTLSPWDRGVVQELRPSPRRALILVDYHVEISEAVNETVPELNEVLEEEISPPVTATQTGFATFSREIQEQSIDASERGELIALPILLVVLLLVFRSPVAAAIPLTFGAITVFTSRGVVALLTNWVDMDAFALTVCTMMGLALGVDYSLLMVSRFREELAGGAEPLEAARITRRTAGRTTIFAGSTLMLSMLVALFIVPGSLLASLAATVALVVVLSVLAAVVPGPALFTLLGKDLDRWRIGAPPSEGSSRLMVLVGAALRRPGLASVLIGIVVAVLAIPALTLKTGPPSPEQLPADNPIRQDAELIDSAVGPGFEAPFVIVAAADKGTITDTDRLNAFAHWQKKIASRPDVQAVVGPGQVADAVAPLRRTGRALLASNGKSGPLASLGRLGRSLGLAAGGVARLRDGLSEATYGAGLLAEGSGRAEEGATILAAGLGQAIAGSERGADALDEFAAGAERLADAQQKASIGALSLKFGIHDVEGALRTNGLPRSRKTQKSLNNDAHVKLPQLVAPAGVANDQLKVALQQMEGMTVGQTDPNFPAALAAVRQALAAVSGTDPVSGQPYATGYTGLPSELSALESRLLTDAHETREVTSWIVTTIVGLKRLSTLAEQLSDGLIQIEKGGRQLEQGARQLAAGTSQLTDGLSQLGDGANALAAGLARLEGGNSTLEESLAAGYSRSYPLQAGLRRAHVRIVSADFKLKRRINRLRRTSPGIFDSGYFVLSALDGTPPGVRERAAGTIDLDNGGQAAALLVISRHTFNSPGSIALNDQLEDDAAALGREANVATGVAGGAATLNTYNRITKERFPLVVAAITIATFLVLIIVLRSLPLAALAVGLNLATVGVAFGILTILTHVPEGWPLGGRTYVDAVGATMIFGVVFGLSIDYAVFLLVRMRERYDVTGDHTDAINFGLEKTARVITGAAAIMMAVFVAFAGAPIANVSQLGIGLTVAVLLDATVIRIVLLPALMLLIGERIWWLPKPLERILPRFDV